MEAVQGLRIDELAGQAGRGFEERHGVEHRLLVVIGRVKLVGPILGDDDVAGGTGTGTAADPAGIEAVLADDLHHAPALDAFEGVALAFAVDHMDDAHETGIP